MKRVFAFLLLFALLLTLLPATFAAEQKFAAITFDDGPHPTITPALLDALAERGVPATFFVNGANAERYPELVLRAAAEGHQIANHTYAHKQLTAQKDKQVTYEVSRTQDYLSELLGEADYMVRVPYGAISERVQELIDVPIILWSVDPTSGKVMSGEKMRDGILRTVHDGCIILLHDTSRANLQAAVESIDAMLAEGYQFVTVEELFRLKGKDAQAGQVYHKLSCPTVEAYFDESNLSEHWAYEDILAVQEAGIMTGDEEGFRPNRGMTRAEVVTVLYRMAGEPACEASTAFKDVKKGDWFAEAVSWAVQEGITSGISKTKFYPQGYVTKEQFYTFFARFLDAMEIEAQSAEAAEVPGDEDAADWAKPAIAALRASGFESREDVTRFAPKSGMTRAEAAEMIGWYLGIKSEQ